MRLGGRKALISHLNNSSRPNAQDDANSLDPEPHSLGRGRWAIEIQLTREDIDRLEEEARAFGAKPHRWIVALIRKRLRGGHQFSRSERIQLADIARQLRKIEAQLFKIARVFSNRQAASSDLINRLDEVSALGKQVIQIKAALGDAFQGDDEYWR